MYESLGFSLESSLFFDLPVFLCCSFYDSLLWDLQLSFVVIASRDWRHTSLQWHFLLIFCSWTFILRLTSSLEWHENSEFHGLWLTSFPNCIYEVVSTVVKIHSLAAKLSTKSSVVVFLVCNDLCFLPLKDYQRRILVRPVFSSGRLILKILSLFLPASFF